MGTPELARELCDHHNGCAVGCNEGEVTVAHDQAPPWVAALQAG
jgi:hypothetical protein